MKTIFLNSKKPVGQTVLGVFMQVKIGLKKLSYTITINYSMSNVNSFSMREDYLMRKY